MKGLWSAAAVWVKEGPGVGRALAEWMVDGEPEIDLHGVGHRALLRAARRRVAARAGARAPEGFNKTYGIVHPAEQWASNRDVRLSPVLRARARSSARSSSRRPAGSARTGTSRTSRCSTSSATGSAARGRVGRALVVADHQRRAPRDARPRGDLRPDRVLRSSTSSGPGALESRAARRRAPDGRAGRHGRLHAGAHAARRLPLRPDDHAARRRALPRRHRRRARHGRPEVVRRPPRRGRHRPDLRPHLGLVHARPLGPARARRSSPRTTGDDVSHEGFPFATLPHDRDGRRCACSRRASPTSATSAGSSTCRSSRARSCGTRSGRPASRTASCRPASASTAPPAGSRSATARSASSSTASTTWSRPAWPGARSRTQDFVGKEAHVRHRDADPAAVLCTLTVDDHTSADGRQALHARRRADPDPRRRAARRRARAGARSSRARAPGRRSASTC